MKANFELGIDSLSLIDTTELARLSGLSESIIRKVSAGNIGNSGVTIPRITRIGNRIKFRRDHVKEWLDELAGINIDKPNRHSSESTTKIIDDHALNRRPGRPRKLGGQR